MEKGSELPKNSAKISYSLIEFSSATCLIKHRKGIGTPKELGENVVCVAELEARGPRACQMFDIVNLFKYTYVYLLYQGRLSIFLKMSAKGLVSRQVLV